MGQGQDGGVFDYGGWSPAREKEGCCEEGDESEASHAGFQDGDTDCLPPGHHQHSEQGFLSKLFAFHKVFKNKNKNKNKNIYLSFNIQT